jgi:hypothetical protein
MKHGCFAIILSVCALAGCQNRAAQELLERELRLQEDRIYELEAQLDQQGGRHCREIPGSIRYEEATEPDRWLNGGSTPAVESPLDPPPAERTPVRPPRVEQPNDLDPPTLRPPKVVPPPGSGAPKIQSTPAPKARESSTHEGSTTGAPRFSPPDKREPWEENAFEIPLEGPSAARPRAKKTSQPKTGSDIASGRITAITLNRVLTGARAGQAGLTVIVEPRDAAGKLQPVAGDVAVVALDPLASGAAARIARWDLGEEDVQHLIEAGSKGIALDLDWPAGPPACRTVNLYVRYVTPDGRELRAEQRLELDVHAPARTTWNKAAPRAAQDAIETSPSDVRTVGHEVEFIPKKKPGPQWSPER